MADVPFTPIEAPVEQQCVYKAPSGLNIALACILMVGGVISFIPQIYKVLRARSSEGVSLSALGLGFIAATFVMINKFILSWNDLLCCQSVWTAAECGGHNLAVWQTIIVPIGILTTIVIVLVYFPLEATKDATNDENRRQKRLGIFMASGVIGLCVVAAAIAAIMHFAAGVNGSVIKVYAQVLGITAAISVVLHWGPQIWITAFVVKSPKNFSVLGLAFQMPGTILIVIFQGLVNHADWSSWVPALVSGIEQFVLIIICVFFLWREWKEAKTVPEISPLLRTDGTVSPAASFDSTPSTPVL